MNQPAPAENLVSPAFLVGQVPLVALSRRDGYGRLGLQLYYTDSFGLAPLRRVAPVFGLDPEDDEQVRALSLNPDYAECIVTAPIHNRLQQVLAAPV